MWASGYRYPPAPHHHLRPLALGDLFPNQSTILTNIIWSEYASLRGEVSEQPGALSGSCRIKIFWNIWCWSHFVSIDTRPSIDLHKASHLVDVTKSDALPGSAINNRKTETSYSKHKHSCFSGMIWSGLVENRSHALQFPFIYGLNV